MKRIIHDHDFTIFQGSQEIPSKQIGYVLRILGQNPTEDDIVEMVMKVFHILPGDLV